MAVSFSGSLDISGSLTTTGTIVMSGSIASASYAATSSFVVSSQTDETQNARLLSNEAKTGSFATTGSNYFIGQQVITGSVYISSNLIVQGSSSLQNITASAVSIGTNTVILNTDTPILRFGGISVQDSGSAQGRSGSLFWDSLNDHWIYVVPSGSSEGYNSAMLMNGPKNTGSLGSETGLTTGYVPRSQGEDHIEDSNIFSTGSNVGINTSTVVEGTQAASSISFIPSSSVSGGPLIQFPGNGRIRPASTGDRLSIDGNALFLNGTFSSTVAIATGGGNVGIGTSSPARKFVVAADDTNSGDSGQFHIIGATNANLKLMLGYDTTSEYAYIKATKSGTSTKNLVLQPDGSNVGIGTTSPIYALDVYATQATYLARFYQPSSTTTNYNAVVWSGAHTPTVGYVAIGGATAGNTSLRDTFAIGTQNAYGFTLVTNDVGRMYVSSSGNIGIGTNSPTYTLDVNAPNNVRFFGNSYTSLTIATTSGTNFSLTNRYTDNRFSIDASGFGEIMNFMSTGKVGIGTVSPNSLVEIVKSSNSGGGATFPRLAIANSLATQGDGSSTYNFADLRLAAGNSAVEVYLTATYAAGTWEPQGILNVATNHPLAFKTNNAERMRILSTGDIQFPNSFAFKSVASSGYIAMYANGGGLYWGGAASTNQMHLNSSGNLGIGTTSPQSPLHVAKAGNVNGGSALLGVGGSGTAKWSYLAGAHYDQATGTGNGAGSAGVAIVGSYAGSTNNDVYMGGGPYEINAATSLLFYTNGTNTSTAGGNERMKITNGGLIQLNSSYSAGIRFANGSTNLNYYEQGSWTPSLANATVSYTYQSGTYVRIGDYVFVRWGFRINTISGQSGTVQINGLPFTSVNWGSYQEPNFSIGTGNLTTADYAQRARLYVGSGGTSLYGRIANNGDTTWPTSELNNGSWIIGEVFYNVP